MSERYISPSVIRRLPKYHRCLKEMQRTGVVRVSSSVLAKTLGFTASQVRQDFSCFGGFGQQGYGYNVESLLAEIAAIIGVDKTHTAAIIGVGHLGHALVNNFRFKTCGFELAVAFDASMSNAITEISCDVLGDSVIMKTEVAGDVTLEMKKASVAAIDFKKVFRKNLEIL